MFQNIELNLPQKIPFLPVRDVVVFPYMMIPLAVGREKSIKSLDAAMSGKRLVFLATQKKLRTENPAREDIFEIGTIAEVLQLLKMPDGSVKILVEGLKKARMIDYIEKKDFVEVKVLPIENKIKITEEVEAAKRNVIYLFEQYVKLNRNLPMDVTLNLNNIEDPERLADTIASHMLIKLKDKQMLLEEQDPIEQLTKISKILVQENDILDLEKKIQGRVRSQIEKSQREYYLNEQLKAIQKELKVKDDQGQEMGELGEKIEKSGMSKNALLIAKKELSRLTKMMPYSPEATVIRTYLDWLITLPWAKKSKDKLEIKEAENILNEDHYGLDKAKERILEYLAVCKLTKKMKGPILCFVGPPGVGKTSLGKSIARALGRSFVRISLGGIRDEAEIRGHRRTYIGALPGRIIQSIKKAKTKNPVFLLDEIDKLGYDFRGDPSSALLEVLDPEQNSTFSDNYLEVEFDLSDVLFITTANDQFSIPPALSDRMEMIRFPGYTTDEKINIAQKYLIPKQMKETGLEKYKISFNDETLEYMAKEYTLEAGVRNLEREISKVLRKFAKNIIKKKTKPKQIKITKEEASTYLGIPKYHRDKHSPNAVGVATGLAWTQFGGDVLNIEVSIMQGKGKLTLTGKLGETMQESAQAALTYIRANAKELGIKEKNFFENKEIHIHVPEGAIPKDGPSAGITILIALSSALLGRAVKKDIAMTGEITLRGRVLAIGGLKEKVLAAQRAGIKTVYYPVENFKDLEDIPKNVQEKVRLVKVKNVKEIIDKVLIKK